MSNNPYNPQNDSNFESQPGPGQQNNFNQNYNPPNNQQGFNQQGFNQQGQQNFNQGGFNVQTSPQNNNQGGFNQQGFNQQGFNQQGYNQQGYNQQGFNQQGYNQQGFNQQGFNQQGQQNYNQGFNQQGNNQGGYNQIPNYNNNNQMNNQNIQQIVNQVKFQLGICDDPMVLLNEAKVAYVKQKPCMMELLTGCETKNIYDVYGRDKNGQAIYLFKCKEDSGCCERQYCRGDSRPFKMLVKHVTNPLIQDEDFMNTWAVYDRPFKCTCFCLERPKLKGYYKNMQGNMFGEVRQPFTCCDPVFTIKDYNKEPKYQIHGDCCQCGLLCRGGIGECSQVVFGIYPVTCSDFDISKSIGTIKKVSAGFLQELLTDADNFEILFPSDASPEEKLLIIGATLMIDYRYFEDGDRNKRNNALDLL